MDVNAPEFLMPSAVSGFSANAAEFVPSSWSGYAPSGHDRSHMSSEAPEFVPGKNYSDEMPYLVNSRPSDDLSTEARGQGPLATGPLHSVAMTGGIYGVESTQPLSDAKVMAQGLGQWGGDEIAGQGGQAAPYIEQFQGRLSTDADDLNAAALQLAGMRDDVARLGMSNMSSEAPEFVPGKEYSGVNSGALSFQALNSGLEYGMDEVTGGDVKNAMSADFLQSVAMANALYGVESTVALGEWGREDKSAVDSAPWGQEAKDDWGLADRRWPGMGEDVNLISKLVRIPQARIALVIGQNGQTVRYIEETCQCRISIEPEVPEAITATVQIQGSCEEVIRKAEGLVEALVEGQIKTHSVMHMEVGDAAAWGASAPSTSVLDAAGCSTAPGPPLSTGPPVEVAMGAKVALDVLFPNLAAQDHDRATARVTAPPRTCTEDYHHSGDWAAQAGVLHGAPPRTYLPPMQRAEEHLPASPMEDPWGASGLAESVAAMALGLDDQDDADEEPTVRLTHAVAAPTERNAQAPSKELIGYKPRGLPPGFPTGTTTPTPLPPGPVATNDMISSQDSMWNTTMPRQPQAAMNMPNRQFPAGWQPPQEPPPSVTPGPDSSASRGSASRPPPPFAPPPPPPADLSLVDPHLLPRRELGGIALRTS